VKKLKRMTFRGSKASGLEIESPSSQPNIVFTACHSLLCPSLSYIIRGPLTRSHEAYHSADNVNSGVVSKMNLAEVSWNYSFVRIMRSAYSKHSGIKQLYRTVYQFVHIRIRKNQSLCMVYKRYKFQASVVIY
jgi:hypothetical protein